MPLFREAPTRLSCVFAILWGLYKFDSDCRIILVYALTYLLHTQFLEVGPIKFWKILIKIDLPDIVNEAKKIQRIRVKKKIQIQKWEII